MAVALCRRGAGLSASIIPNLWAPHCQWHDNWPRRVSYLLPGYRSLVAYAQLLAMNWLPFILVILSPMFASRSAPSTSLLIIQHLFWDNLASVILWLPESRSHVIAFTVLLCEETCSKVVLPSRPRKGTWQSKTSLRRAVVFKLLYKSRLITTTLVIVAQQAELCKIPLTTWIWLLLTCKLICKCYEGSPPPYRWSIHRSAPV